MSVGDKPQPEHGPDITGRDRGPVSLVRRMFSRKPGPAIQENALEFRITRLLLASVLFTGLAFIALLPPWEGFDETAHWSYIQQLSDTGTWPKYGVSGLSEDLAAYPGPMPYAAAPPFERTGFTTYRMFRLEGAQSVAGGPSRFVKSGTPNWQAQHGPLYYALMVPVYRAAKSLNWREHFLVLRIASFSVAFLGFAFGVFASMRHLQRAAPGSALWIGPAMAAWPFCFPQFFPEFCRLGNDSLCLLLVSIAWALTLRLLRPDGRRASAPALGCALGLGCVLGLGLLTKVFFLPVSSGVGLLLVARYLQDRRNVALLRQAVMVGALAVAIGGWWYLSKFAETGSFTGADEFIRMRESGAGAGVSFAQFLRSLLAMPATFVWAGTWSLARLPEVLLVPLVALLAIQLAGYGGRLIEQTKSGWREKRFDLAEWAPAAFAAPLAAALLYHAAVTAFTPAWYLHILAAPLGFAFARGRWRPALTAWLLAYTLAYATAASAFQLSMFSGCATKAGADRHYALQDAGCFIDWRVLSQVTHPGLAVPCLLAGAAFGIGAVLLAVRSRRRDQTTTT